MISRELEEELIKLIMQHDREYLTERGTYYHSATLANRIMDLLEGEIIE